MSAQNCRICFITIFIYCLSLDSRTAAVVMETDDPFEEDLTVVTWAHAVNSKAKLDQVLKGSVTMMEADVVLGYLKDSPTSKLMPVMAHPPKTSSDLSLEEFLTTVSQDVNSKGVKLDFKSREAFAASEALLHEYQDVTFPLWLNADILPGPVDCHTKTVDPDYFLSTCVTKFPQATLSVGWTTCYGNGVDTASYTRGHISNMTEALNRNAVVQPVTFAVRAGIAAQSYQSLSQLMATSAPGTSLTIWSSSDGDYVNINDLRKLVNNIGKNKIYLDLPEDMTDELLLSAAPPNSLLPPLPLLLILASLTTMVYLL